MNARGLSLRAAFFSSALFSMLALAVLPAFSQQASPASPPNGKWSYAALANVPPKARTIQNPLATDPDRIAAGGKLFEQHCSECHGMKAEGGKRGPSLLRPEVQDASEGSLFWILTNGVIRHGMPDWSKLPEAQRWQLVAFLKSFKAPSAN
jgi:mono/diheme cytochrome c family protein